MFLVTGDVHADIKDFLSRPFGKVKKDDSVVVCGDFGLVWDGSEAELKNIRKIGKRKYKTLFVDGAHENFDLLGKYPVTEWNGGTVRVISGNLIQLMRGQVYEISGKKVFTFGGGESSDREMRTDHQTWWEQELPTMDEMKQGINNLVANDWKVDYIFTHEAPSSVRRFLKMGDSELNSLNVYLDYIREKCRYQKWVFGSYHKNRRISPIHEVVYDGVVKLE